MTHDLDLRRVSARTRDDYAAEHMQDPAGAGPPDNLRAPKGIALAVVLSAALILVAGLIAWGWLR